MRAFPIMLCGLAIGVASRELHDKHYPIVLGCILVLFVLVMDELCYTIKRLK